MMFFSIFCLLAPPPFLPSLFCAKSFVAFQKPRLTASARNEGEDFPSGFLAVIIPKSPEEPTLTGRENRRVGSTPTYLYLIFWFTFVHMQSLRDSHVFFLTAEHFFSYICSCLLANSFLFTYSLPLTLGRWEGSSWAWTQTRGRWSLRRPSPPPSTCSSCPWLWILPAR